MTWQQTCGPLVESKKPGAAVRCEIGEGWVHHVLYRLRADIRVSGGFGGKDYAGL